MSVQSVRSGGLRKKTGCGFKYIIAEAVKQPGHEEECHREEESDTNAGVDGCSTDGN